MPFRVERLKTGTPARIDGRTIDFSKMDEQPGDSPIPVFSFMGSVEQHPDQVSCYITHTNEKTHDLIRDGLDRSPLYTGVIEGVGPRYCPSIEDKIMRFSDKNSHQIFVEPEGLSTYEVYPNGISTSLPYDVQWHFIRSIIGFEQAIITRPGYAIEYDYFDPRDLKPTLETSFIEGLFFAGQINGTTGYEEAAGQGLLAGINAALQIQGRESWFPKRNEAYIGVLVDDLITMGTKEPYRMFTSRAEYRLQLREDNADLRLTEKAHELGLISEARWKAFNEKCDSIAKEEQRMKTTWLQSNSVDDETANKILGNSLKKEACLMDLLRRPEVTYNSLMSLPNTGEAVLDPAVAEQIEIKAKYQGYIERQQLEIDKLKRNEETILPDGFDFEAVKGLSNEVMQKLMDHKPANIGQASRISGVTPAAISLLLVYLKKNRSAA